MVVSLWSVVVDMVVLIFDEYGAAVVGIYFVASAVFDPVALAPYYYYYSE